MPLYRKKRGGIVAVIYLLHHASRLDRPRPARGLLSVRLLLPPLPLQQNPYEVLEIKIWPQTLAEENVRVLVALPEHKVAESLNAACPDKEVQRRVIGGIYVSLDGVDCDGVGVGQRRRAVRSRPREHARFRGARGESGGSRRVVVVSVIYIFALILSIVECFIWNGGQKVAAVELAGKYLLPYARWGKWCVLRGRRR